MQGQTKQVWRKANFNKEAWKEEQKQRAFETAQKVLTRFESGEAIKFVSIAYLEQLNLNSDKWSLGNKLIMMVNNTKDARTYEQWKQVGRYVKAGTQGFDILGPVKIMVPEDKDKPNDGKIPILIGFKPIRVHPVENTEGAEVEYVKGAPKQLPPLADVATKWGLSVTYGRSRHGEFGFYRPSEDLIHLSTADMSTFFHELTHAAQKKIDGKLNGGQDTDQEVIAEFTACVLADMYGQDSTGFGYHYIRGYVGGDKDKVTKCVMRLISKIQKILDLIIDAKADLSATNEQQTEGVKQ